MARFWKHAKSLTIISIVMIMFVIKRSECGSCREAKMCCTGRDSSCVVQKTPINAIIEDLNDKPCYCDHACLQLGDCCPDLKEACGVEDCVVSEWDPWSECNTDCGAGTMTRSRVVFRKPRNGGKSCPPLTQKRGCLGTHCPHNPRSALKETAMLLPASLAISRRMNETHDIRSNLRFRYAKNLVEEHNKQYCVQFHVLKASKACRKVSDFSSLKEGEIKCVRCELQAMRPSLGYRCPGHGTMERATRWTALSAPHCHGKWVRLEINHAVPLDADDSCSACPGGGEFIFV